MNTPNKDKSRLDHPFTVTSFPSRSAYKKIQYRTSLNELTEEIMVQKAANKAGLPWYKCATFGNEPTDKNCLRNDANVLSVTGIECDYDDEKIKPEEAASLLENAAITALVYTTPSHTADKPHWRVMAALSTPMQGDGLKELRAALVARINGLFDGTLDGASFNLSQSFYAGNVDGKPEIKTYLINGNRFIDEANDLDITALGKGKKRIKNKDGGTVKVTSKKDESGSGHGWRFLLQCVRNSMNKEQAEKAISEDKGPAGQWYRTSPNMAHQFTNTWARAQPVIQADVDTICKRHFIEPDEKRIKRIASLQLDLTENGAALLLAELHGQNYRFDRTIGKWFKWAGHLWVRDDRGTLSNEIRIICEALAHRGIKKPVFALLKASAVSGTERLARSLPRFSTLSSEWEQDGWLLGTPGGIVNLRTGELRPGKHTDMITRSTAATPIPLAEFDPAKHCPNWLRFLEEATNGDQDLIRFLKNWFGYNLTGVTTEQSLLFVHGPGGTGKSTIINVIGDLLGGYCVNVESETLTESQFERHTTELARLDGSRMARVSEVKAGKRWEQKRIIALTGGDKITARYMRQNNFEFSPQFKLTIVGNSRPGFAQMDSAIKRRMIIVPFDHKPSKPDRKLQEKLSAEGPGILAWLIQGCLDWQSNGLARPQIVQDYTTEYTNEQDFFAQWIEEKCETSSDFSQSTRDLWESWNFFASSSGEDPGHLRGEFQDRMKEHGFTASKHCGPKRTQRGYKGLRLKDITINSKPPISPPYGYRY